ncbi:MAG: magnesium/cobalt transporter CorA [Segetibacter sp.]
MRPDRYLKHIIQPLFHQGRTKEIFKYNPAVQPKRDEAKETKLHVFNYSATSLEGCELKSIEETFPYRDRDTVSWINIEGLKKDMVETVCAHYGIHHLIVEDILSIGQRPKMDDIEGILYCLQNMLYFNEQRCSVEQEQISIVLGKNFLLTFQDDAHRDVFDGLRERLRLGNSKLRLRGADYLCYSLLDMIVDHYFGVMEKLGEKIELLEEEIIRSGDKRSLAKISSFRKELIVLKRNVAPVREVINGFIRSESDLLDDKVTKYYKDIYDHIVQANEVAENYREIMTSLQDLYISQVNLKMNEVMKVMAIVTCILAPATVIGGIFGMNFDVIPYAHQQWGFYATVALMLIIPVIMLVIFKRRRWF